MIARALLLFMVMGSARAWNVFVSTSEVAQGQAAGSTSSFFFGSENLNATADLAVDGDPNGDFLSGSCFSSDFGDTDPVWYVDLGANMEIYSVKIFNRGDCCADRLRDITIDVVENNPLSGSPGNVVNCGSIGDPGGVGLNETIEIVCPFLTFQFTSHYEKYFRIAYPEGQYIRIMKTGDELLNFCEVEVQAATGIFYKYPSKRSRKGDRNDLVPQGFHAYQPSQDENVQGVPVPLPYSDVNHVDEGTADTDGSEETGTDDQ
ncbi:fucolectin-like [Haliotis rubra]|uniref:fucolectin-like n=1 Tax=Haliotis rubra TaxID=36100 RepID=UPI001EE5B2A4|nr:fucolectin-like [Haliotis rubra]XP_046561225.1 fucolectin-like [Haliotis rubra]